MSCIVGDQRALLILKYFPSFRHPKQGHHRRVW